MLNQGKIVRCSWEKFQSISHDPDILYVIKDKGQIWMGDKCIADTPKDIWSLGIVDTEVGKTVKITEVDDSGKPTKWEAVTDNTNVIPIQFVENTDSENKLPLRSLESGTYILKGYFTSYEGGTQSYTFSTGMLVAVVKTDTITYVQIFYPKNNTIQYVEISDTEVTRKDAKLVNMETVANMVTVVDNTSDDSHYPSAKAVYDAIEALCAELQSGT